MISRVKQNPLLRRVLRRALVGRTTTRRYPGDIGSLMFPADQHLNLFFRKHAILEKTVTANLARLIRPGDLVFDIGANIGYYTVLLSRWVGSGRVVAVEPDPQNHAVLLQNLVRNHLRNVSAVCQAVSAQSGMPTLFRDTATGRSSSLEQTAWHPERDAIVPVAVAATTIDHLTEEFGAPALIKCDVEGHEVAALEGARKTLLGQPMLMLEVAAANRVAVERLLSRYGYVFQDAGTALADCPPQQSLKGFNVLATPSSNAESG